MKKTFSSALISLVFILNFIIPYTVFGATEWYFTKTNNLLYNSSSGAVTFIKATSASDCNVKREATQSQPNYTIGQCTEKVEAPAGEGWGYSVDTEVAPMLANNPIGFKTEEDCNINRGAYLDSDVHKNDSYFKSISSCIYKKGISNEGVVYVTPKIGAVEKNDTYKLLVPLPGLTCMDPTGADKNCMGNNIMYYLNFIFKLGIGVCAALAVVMLIIYGVVYMGDESVFSKTESKKKMMGAVVGLVISLGSWMLLNTINPDLTGKNGFKVAKVSIKIDNFTASGSLTFDGKPIQINFNKQAYPAAKIASEKTGVETAFILAMFAQETSNGSNTGKCNYTTANMGNGQLEALKRVAAKLNISDISTINMSCSGAVSGDHGGAIGLTQFIPTTWEMYSDKAKTLLGHEPNPWDVNDALMMTAIFLQSNGGAGSNIANQESAACKYFGSCSQTVSCGGGVNGTYGQCILGKKVSIQQQIDESIKKGEIS